MTLTAASDPEGQATPDERIVEIVRAHYAAAATAVATRDGTPARASCCGDSARSDDSAGSDDTAACCGDTAGREEPSAGGAIFYALEERSELPEAALLASLGCGNPVAVAELREGERVLDLGSGGGIDVLLSARRVGPTGKAYGLDMTDEMLAIAVSNAAEAGLQNVEFLRGRIEAIPLPASTIDVVISNCVINLSADKPTVFAEMERVLRPGGRIGISDIVASDELSVPDRLARGSYTGCIAGALSIGEYEAGLRAAGFDEVSVTPMYEAADRMYGAIIKATKPHGAVAGG
jgi:SAM-dependent methyltransferase